MTTTSPPTNGRDQRVQQQTALRRGQQHAEQAARERSRDDFERAIERASKGVEPRTTMPARPPAPAADGTRPTPPHAPKLDVRETSRTTEAAGPNATATTAAPAAAPRPADTLEPRRTAVEAVPQVDAAQAMAARAPRADEAPASWVEALSPAAGTAAFALAAPPAAGPAQAPPSHPGAPDLPAQQHRLPPIAEDPAAATGRWRFELADASLPVKSLALERTRAGGLQLAVGGAADALAPPLDALRERLAGRGVAVEAVRIAPPDEALADG